MSLLTPERVPVKVYRWDDDGAPALDKTAGCMMTILKACLVTGYGTKESAGWTMPFEDTSAGVKVFKPNSQPEISYDIRVANDTGVSVGVAMYRDMTDANTGSLIMQCDTPFKYGTGITSGRWVLVASPRAFWLFLESKRKSSSIATQQGAYIFTGCVASLDGLSGVYIKHTGGTNTNTDSDRTPITGSDVTGSNVQYGKADVRGVLFSQTKGVVKQDPMFMFTGSRKLSESLLLAPLCLISANEVFLLPLYTGSNNSRYNFDQVDQGGIKAINCCTGTFYTEINNTYVASDNWAY